MSKAQVLEAIAPLLGGTAGAVIGRSMGKRKVKKMMSKGLINRLRFALDPGLKREIINRYAGSSTAVGMAGPMVAAKLMRLKSLIDSSRAFRSGVKLSSASLSAMCDEMSKIAGETRKQSSRIEGGGL